MLKNIKTIIFDLGGVMIQLNKQRCIDSFTAIGFPQAASLIDCYHPVEFFEAFERGETTIDELCERICAEAGHHIPTEDIQRAYSDFLVTIPTYKLRMIDSLRERGYRILALSNINPLVMPKVYEMFRADGKEASDYFDKMYLSFEMKSIKPNPEIFHALIADSGIEPSEALFIDDGERNVVAGKEIGFNVYLADADEDYSHIFEE